VNDIVLGCHLLQKKFQKILYIDLDAHHGDGVENAFSLTPNIMTQSCHIREPGFYPGTGGVEEVGSGRGKYHSVNVPLKSYVADSELYYAFNEILPSVLEFFRADAIVVQCGVDCVSGDPVGKGNLSEKGLGQCITKVLDLQLPTLFLGGGGYNKANSAKCWTYLTSLITGVSISYDIPDHNNFLLFGPDFDLGITVSPVKSLNTKEYLDCIILQIKDNLAKLKNS
jgi:histone deacetylase 8